MPKARIDYTDAAIEFFIVDPDKAAEWLGQEVQIPADKLAWLKRVDEDHKSAQRYLENLYDED